MEVVKATIGIGDPMGDMFENLEVEVTDGGRTYTEVPRSLLRKLGVPVEKTIPVRTRDGSTIHADLGTTFIRVEGWEFPTPIIFGDDGGPSVLGMVSLHAALLRADTGAGCLVPVDIVHVQRVGIISRPSTSTFRGTSVDC